MDTGFVMSNSLFWSPRRQRAIFFSQCYVARSQATFITREKYAEAYYIKKIDINLEFMTNKIS